MRVSPLLFALILSFSSISYASAQQASSSQDRDGNVQFTFNGESSVKIAPKAAAGVVGGACSGTSEGAMRYNPTSKSFEGCNGVTWSPLAGAPPTPHMPAVRLVESPPFAHNSTNAYCAADEVLVGGGGGCGGGTLMAVTSRPDGNGWFTTCAVGGGAKNPSVKAYAICAKR